MFLSSDYGLKRSSQPVYRYQLNRYSLDLKSGARPVAPTIHDYKVEGRRSTTSSILKDWMGQVNIYPDFNERAILFVENVGDYQIQAATF